MVQQQIVEVLGKARSLPISVSKLQPLAVFMATFSVMVAPANAQMRDAVCSTGVGDLLAMIIALLALGLAYYSIFDFYNGFKKGNSKDSQKRATAGNDYQSAFKKIVGSVFIASSPDFLTALGFNLLDCVSVVQIFS
ncbi:hypothetical protein [Halocatena marina]|uniref:hypothetical protein n=1 Tax=Halocatena marina TaxID=2934937 RepID=UPI00200CCFC0|nr:hypothetical protein [Halocatena marina]